MAVGTSSGRRAVRVDGRHQPQVGPWPAPAADRSRRTTRVPAGSSPCIEPMTRVVRVASVGPAVHRDHVTARRGRTDDDPLLVHGDRRTPMRPARAPSAAPTQAAATDHGHRPPPTRTAGRLTLRPIVAAGVSAAWQHRRRCPGPCPTRPVGPVAPGSRWPGPAGWPSPLRASQPRGRAEPGMRHLTRTVDRIGLLQIDSVNVLSRAHYLPLFSRLGPYDRSLLDRATTKAPRRLVEYWAHEASLVPPSTRRLMGWRMRRSEEAWGGIRSIAVQRPDLVKAVLAEVTDRAAPMTAGQVEARPRARRAARQGRLGLELVGGQARAASSSSTPATSSSAGRTTSFERRYALPERVLPREVLAAPEPSDEEAFVELVRIAARAHGVAYRALPARLLPDGPGRHQAGGRALVDAGELLPVEVEGWSRPAYLHHEARRAAGGPGAGAAGAVRPAGLVPVARRSTSSTSTTGSRSTCPPSTSGCTATTCCPSCSATGWWPGSTSRPTGSPSGGAGVLRVRSAFAEPSAPPETAVELAAELRAMADWLGLADVVVERRGDLAAALDLAVRSVRASGRSAGSGGSSSASRACRWSSSRVPSGSRQAPRMTPSSTKPAFSATRHDASLPTVCGSEIRSMPRPPNAQPVTASSAVVATPRPARPGRRAVADPRAHRCLEVDLPQRDVAGQPAGGRVQHRERRVRPVRPVGAALAPLDARSSTSTTSRRRRSTCRVSGSASIASASSASRGWGGRSCHAPAAISTCSMGRGAGRSPPGQPDVLVLVDEHRSVGSRSRQDSRCTDSRAKPAFSATRQEAVLASACCSCRRCSPSRSNAYRAAARSARGGDPAAAVLGQHPVGRRSRGCRRGSPTGPRPPPPPPRPTSTAQPSVLPSAARRAHPVDAPQRLVTAWPAAGRSPTARPPGRRARAGRRRRRRASHGRSRTPSPWQRRHRERLRWRLGRARRVGREPGVPVHVVRRRRRRGRATSARRPRTRSRCARRPRRTRRCRPRAPARSGAGPARCRSRTAVATAATRDPAAAVRGVHAVAELGGVRPVAEADQARYGRPARR